MSAIEPQMDTDTKDYAMDNTAETFEKSSEAKVGVAVVDQGRIIPLSGERKVTTRREYWAYCIFYIGLSGTGGYNFGPAQFQNLLSQQFPSGFLSWGGGTKSINAMILDINGVTFAIQTCVFLFVGPYADYGNWRPYILIACTLMSWCSGFAWLGIETPDKWKAATAMYIFGYMGYALCFAFYSAAFPGIVRDLPKIIESEQQVLDGTKDPEAHAELNMLERSKLVNISLIFSSVGTTVVLALGLVIPVAMGYATTEENTKVYSVLIAYFTAVWVLAAIPWFLWEQRRPGQKLPPNTNYFAVGPKQLFYALKCAWQLKHTLLYLVAFFLVNDVLNTSGTIIGLLLNEVIEFDTFISLALYMLVFGGQIIGVAIMHFLQQKLKWEAKWLLFTCCTCIVIMPFWGLIGLWTDKIGYHNKWEFWLYQAWNGVAIGGWYSYSNAMISEVVPAPKMYMFFSLFNIVGKTSAFIGPFITSAIIDDAGGNTSAAFWFLVFSGLVGVVLLCFVNPSKAKVASAEYLEREAAERY